MPYNQQPTWALQYWKKPIGISDGKNVPISDAEAAQMRRNATRDLLNIPSQLHELAVGKTWDRTPEQSMVEFRFLNAIDERIQVLKALNIMGRERLRGGAKTKRKEAAPGVLKAMEYRVRPEEIEQTRNELRGLRERGRMASRVKDVEARIMDGVNRPHHHDERNVLSDMRGMEFTMDMVRSKFRKLQEDNPDGHWASEILNFYMDAWIVWLNEVGLHCRDWYPDVFNEKMDVARSRFKTAVEAILNELRGERIERKAFGHVGYENRYC